MRLEDFVIFESPEGRRILEKLERICDPRCRQYGTRIDEPNAPAPDPNKTLYREGQRSVYWYIVTMIEQSRMAPVTKEDNDT